MLEGILLEWMDSSPCCVGLLWLRRGALGSLFPLLHALLTHRHCFTPHVQVWGPAMRGTSLLALGPTPDPEAGRSTYTSTHSRGFILHEVDMKTDSLMWKDSGFQL